MSNKHLYTRRSVFTTTFFFLAAACTPAFAQGYRFNPEHRRPVAATLQDLQQIGSYEAGRAGSRERDRFSNAIRHLQQFGDRLHERGQFDKDKLDEAIEDVQNIIDHNRLPERARQILFRDVTELRRLRQHYDDSRYRYR